MSSQTPLPPAAVTPGGPELSCSRCAAPVAAEQLADGSALTKDGRLLCPLCVEHLRTLRKDKDKSAPVEHHHLEHLVHELQNLIHILGSERFSFWNVAGGLAQAAALAVMVLAIWEPASQARLLWAILIQLIALTFFTAARK